ncbi:MAG: hypothetical protein IJ105_02300 [Bacilli bacterium]|nr:hypothetical protein [Bacilli bacterium]
METIEIHEYKKKIEQLSELKETVKPLLDKMNDDNKSLKLKNNKLANN